MYVELPFVSWVKEHISVGAKSDCALHPPILTLMPPNFCLTPEFTRCRCCSGGLRHLRIHRGRQEDPHLQSYRTAKQIESHHQDQVRVKIRRRRGIKTESVAKGPMSPPGPRPERGREERFGFCCAPCGRRNRRLRAAASLQPSCATKIT